MIHPSYRGWPIAVSLLVFVLLLILDFRRRRLTVAGFLRQPMLAQLDLLPVPVSGACAALLIAALTPVAAATGVLPIRSTALLGAVLCLVLLPVFWAEGKKLLQFQRPTGLLFAEGLFAAGAAGSLVTFLVLPPQSRLTPAVLFGAALLIAGAMVAKIVPPFMRKYEGLRILDRVASDEQFSQPEYTPATPECPHPELWRMLDSQTTELEVLDFLKTLVTTVKPRVIVETGTFLGHGTVKLAEGARENGFGKVITVEFDPEIRRRAVQRFEESGLSPWIESRLESSLETVIDGKIDFLYSDSHLANREAEIRRLLPQLDPQGLLVIHDASSHFKIVREAALRLEAEGLISTVLLSTPRGVVVAQRREGRQ
jgi:predicted O-methyltransferase YrrM